MLIKALVEWCHSWVQYCIFGGQYLLVVACWQRGSWPLRPYLLFFWRRRKECRTWNLVYQLIKSILNDTFNFTCQSQRNYILWASRGALPQTTMVWLESIMRGTSVWASFLKFYIWKEEGILCGKWLPPVIYFSEPHCLLYTKCLRVGPFTSKYVKICYTIYSVK